MLLALRTMLSQVNLRHALDHRLRTALTVAGIAAGVTLAVSISLINATLASGVRSAGRELAGAAEIEVAGADRTGLDEDAVALVDNVDGVEHTVPVLRGFSRVRGQEKSARLMIVGVTPEFASLFPEGLGELGEVELEGGFGTGRGLILSEESRHLVDAQIGDTVEIETPEGFSNIEVTGVISSGVLTGFNGGEVGTMLLPAAQRTFAREGRVDSIFVVARADASLDETEERIDRALGGGAIVGPPGARSGGFSEALDGINALTASAGTVALFVAAFIVYNTMSMSLAERRREISMMLALGATRGHVFTTFLGEALVLGAIASGLGVLLGIGSASLFVGPALDSLRVFDINASGSLVVPAGALVVGGLSGLAVALIGALIPARRVHRLAPIESLRPQAAYEWGREGSKRRNMVRNAVGLLLLAGATFVLAINPADVEDLGWLTNLGLALGLTGATLLLPTLVPAGIDVIRPLIRRAFGAPGHVAMHALRNNPGRTTVTAGALVFTLGIAVGLASALASFESQWNRSSLKWFGAPIYVDAGSYNTVSSDQPMPAGTARIFEQVEGVEAALPERYRVVNIDGRQTVMYVIPLKQGLESEASLSPPGREYRAELAESLLNGGIVISRYMAERNGLAVGDRVTIPTPSGERSFMVGDVVPDLNTLDSLYLDGETFVELWKDGSVDRFGVTLEPRASQDEVMSELRHVIETRALEARVLTRRESVGVVFDSIESLFSVARGIQAAALFVAALAIANTMLIAIFERRWELGLQRAIGMGRAQMTRSLLVEAGAIGVVGGLGATLLGLGLGVMMVKGMGSAYAFDVPFRPSWVLVALALTVGTAIAAVAGLYPSRTAVRVPIIESLRYE
jgi:putative ABC transport system permease protein